MDETEILIVAALAYFLFIRKPEVHTATPAPGYYQPQPAPQQSGTDWLGAAFQFGSAAIGALANIGSGGKTDGDGSTYYPSSGYSVDAGPDGNGYDPNDPSLF